MSDVYNTYSSFPEFPYKIIETLIESSTADKIWKLLKYDTSSALDGDALTTSEKAALVYNGENISTPFRVFRDSFTDDGQSEEKTILGIYIQTIIPENRTTGILNICFEVYTHPKINHLNNYTQRIDTIIQALLNTFQDKEILGGAGSLFFNRDRSYSHIIKLISSGVYRGKSLTMGINMVS